MTTSHVDTFARDNLPPLHRSPNTCSTFPSSRFPTN